MLTAIFIENATGDVARVEGIYEDGSQELRDALRTEPPTGIGERVAIQDRIPQYSSGALIEGRTTRDQRVWGIVTENRLHVDLSYRVRGFIDGAAVEPHVYDVDVRRESAQVRLIARVLSPIPCGLHGRTIENGRAFFVTEADGDTPAREAVLTQQLALHVPCDDDSAHAIEVLTGDQVELDVARSPWPAPDRKAHAIAKLVQSEPGQA